MILTADTLDDRRELWSLLHRISPGDRVRTLRRICDGVKHPTGNRPVPRFRRDEVEQAYRCDRADERLTNAVYGDLIALAAQWGVDLVKVGVELEALSRGQPACGRRT